MVSRRTSTQSKSGLLSSKGRPGANQENLFQNYSRDPSHIKIDENMSEQELDYKQKKPRVKTAVRKPIRQRIMIAENDNIKPLNSNQNTILNQRQEMGKFLSRVTSQNDSKR